MLYYQASNILRLRMLGVQISNTSRPPCLRGCCLDTHVFTKNVVLVGWSKVVTWIWSWDGLSWTGLWPKGLFRGPLSRSLFFALSGMGYILLHWITDRHLDILINYMSHVNLRRIKIIILLSNSINFEILKLVN